MGRQRRPGAETLNGRIAATAALALALGGCGDGQDAREARDGVRIAWEVMRGEPSEARLREAAGFQGGGVSFDYPRPLRAGAERSAEGAVWTFRYGEFELELWSNDGTLQAHEYLANIGQVFEDDLDGTLSRPPRDGRTLVVCGEPRVSSVMEIRYMGEPMRYESIDLPPDPRGRGRILTFNDGSVRGKAPSRTAAATEALVLSSLRCDASGPSTSGNGRGHETT